MNSSSDADKEWLRKEGFIPIEYKDASGNEQTTWQHDMYFDIGNYAGQYDWGSYGPEQQPSVDLNINTNIEGARQEDNFKLMELINGR